MKNILFYLTRATGNDISNLHTSLLGHESDNRKYDKSCKDGGAAVGQGNEDGIPVAVVGELVVTGEGDEPTKRGAKRVEDLSGGICPHLDGLEGLQLWLDVELNSLGSSVESGTPDQEDEQDKVGEQGSEVHNLKLMDDNILFINKYCFMFLYLS